MPTTFVSIVTSSDDFNILALAVTAAGLVPDLSDPEADLTVFAPTDAAFVALANDLGLDVDPDDEQGVFDALAGALAGLNEGDPIPLLKNILLYHVSPGAKLLADVAALEDVPTLLNGATFSPLDGKLVDNEPDLKDPGLVQTDLEVGNGVIHVIDRVLIPLDIPGNEPQQITVEAEDMDLSGYVVRHDRDASGDELIKLSGKEGSASTTFDGVSGQYDMELFYFDEIDGRSTIEVLVNGESVQTIKLDQHLGGVVATAGNATSAKIEGLHLNNGDTVEFIGTRDFYEFARIDKAVFTPVEEKPTIAELATENGNFEILLMALEAAELTSPFTSPDSDLTVFAPTDDAFFKLAQDFGYEGEAGDKSAVFNAIAGALSDLAGGDPIPLLTNVLLYHVSPGAKLLEDVAALEDVPTLLEGATFSPDGASLVDNEPDLEDPSLVATDLQASNGVVHIIDRVLIPIDIPGNGPTIVDTVVASDDFNILALAVGAAGLVSALSNPEADLTVFAPTDAAFVSLAKDLGLDVDPADEQGVFDTLAGALAELNDGDPIPLLKSILEYHVSPGAKLLADVAELEDVPTLLEGVTFSPVDGKLVDNEPDLKDPGLLTTDLEVENGVIHVIDRVLLPIDIPGNEAEPITIEAEDMHLNGYRVEHDKDASGDQLIKLSSWKGEASTSFDGQSGEYDLELFYFDEIDGRSTVDILINGEKVEKVKFNEHLGGFTATSDNATSVVIEDLHLEHGDTISFIGKRSFFEFARLDKVVIAHTTDDDMMAPGNNPEDMMV